MKVSFKENWNYLAALLVGIPRECIASLHKNSLTEERSTALPSPFLGQIRVKGFSVVMKTRSIVT